MGAGVWGAYPRAIHASSAVMDVAKDVKAAKPPPPAGIAYESMTIGVPKETAVAEAEAAKKKK